MLSQTVQPDGYKKKGSSTQRTALPSLPSGITKKQSHYYQQIHKNRGEWVKENIPEGGGTSLETLKHHRPAENGQTIPTLKDAGIGHHESPKLRTIAGMPEEEFEQHRYRGIT